MVLVGWYSIMKAKMILGTRMNRNTGKFVEVASDI